MAIIIIIIYLLLGVVKVALDFSRANEDPGGPRVPMYASAKRYSTVPLVILFWPIISILNGRF